MFPTVIATYNVYTLVAFLLCCSAALALWVFASFVLPPPLPPNQVDKDAGQLTEDANTTMKNKMSEWMRAVQFFSEKKQAEELCISRRQGSRPLLFAAMYVCLTVVLVMACPMSLLRDNRTSPVSLADEDICPVSMIRKRATACVHRDLSSTNTSDLLKTLPFVLGNGSNHTDGNKVVRTFAGKVVDWSMGLTSNYSEPIFVNATTANNCSCNSSSEDARERVVDEDHGNASSSNATDKQSSSSSSSFEDSRERVVPVKDSFSLSSGFAFAILLVSGITFLVLNANGKDAATSGEQVDAPASAPARTKRRATRTGGVPEEHVDTGARPRRSVRISAKN